MQQLRALIPLFLLFYPASAEPPRGRVERVLAAMGTELRVVVEGPDRRTALEASERAVRAVARTEQRLSTWRSDSELSRLNRAPVGQPIEVSPELAAEIDAARRCWRETGGAFDPALGSLVAAFGLRTGGEDPTPRAWRRARNTSGMSHVRLGTAHTVIRELEGLRLEEGGFGKGAGLAAALRSLELMDSQLRGYLDLGGQAVVFGDHLSWTLTVADPRDRHRPVVELTLDRGSVATTGNSERGIHWQGRRRSHVLDPHSGRPLDDFGSVTVWANDPLRADCLSTGLYALGAQGALRWASSHEAVEALVLESTPRGLEATATAGLAPRIRALDRAVSITVYHEERGADVEPRYTRKEGGPGLARPSARPRRFAQ